MQPFQLTDSCLCRHVVGSRCPLGHAAQQEGEGCPWGTTGIAYMVFSLQWCSSWGLRIWTAPTLDNRKLLVTSVKAIWVKDRREAQRDLVEMKIGLQERWQFPENEGNFPIKGKQGEFLIYLAKAGFRVEQKETVKGRIEEKNTLLKAFSTILSFIWSWNVIFHVPPFNLLVLKHME